MKPGQLTPNAFEVAVLRTIVGQPQALVMSIESLHVLSREFTCVGSFTKFKCSEPDTSPRRHMGLNALVTLPGVPNGLGAVLHMLGREPECLEVFTFGTEAWDGTIEGFSIASAA